MTKFKTVTVIDVSDWDELVKETYGKPYSFQQQDGCKERQTVHLEAPCEEYDFDNDTIPEEVNGEEMGVSFKAWLARDPKQQLDSEDEWEREYGLDLFWERNFYPHVSMIINDLHSKGLIPTGEFAIEIDW